MSSGRSAALLFVAGALIMAWNLWMTIRGAEATEAAPRAALQPAE